MNATIGLSQSTESYEHLITYANQVFGIVPFEQTYCGGMTYLFVRDIDDLSIDDSFYFVDDAYQEVTLRPELIHTPGLYDGYYFLFYYIDHPDR